MLGVTYLKYGTIGKEKSKDQEMKEKELDNEQPPPKKCKHNPNSKNLNLNLVEDSKEDNKSTGNENSMELCKSSDEGMEKELTQSQAEKNFLQKRVLKAGDDSLQLKADFYNNFTVKQVPDASKVNKALDYIMKETLKKHFYLPNIIILSLKNINFFEIETASSLSSFLDFICKQCSSSSDPILLLKLQKLLLSLMANPKNRFTYEQINDLLNNFLFPCMVTKYFNNMNHVEIRHIVGEILALLCKGPDTNSPLPGNPYHDSYISYINEIIETCSNSLGTQQWYGIITLALSLGSQAIQSILVPHRLKIFELISTSCRPHKYINSQLLAYSDASFLRAQFLKACKMLLTDVIKEDIFYPANTNISVSVKDINCFQTPDPIERKFNHQSLQPFFHDCFQCFGDAITFHVYNIFAELEASNRRKKLHMQQFLNLSVRENKYVIEQSQLSLSPCNYTDCLDTFI